MRVIFSDGSKQMAHNLDDLYERWMLRRSEGQKAGIAEVDVENSLDIFVPDLPENLTFETAVQVSNTIVEKRFYIEEALMSLKARRESMTHAEFENYRQPMGAAIRKLSDQQGKLRAFTRQDTPAFSTARISMLKLKEQKNGLSTSEQKELAQLRAESINSSILGEERSIAGIKPGELQENVEKLESLVKSLRINLTKVQEKLIEAYERIIQYEEGER